jgi:hypothetical protein
MTDEISISEWIESFRTELNAEIALGNAMTGCAVAPLEAIAAGTCLEAAFTDIWDKLGEMSRRRYQLGFCAYLAAPTAACVQTIEFTEYGMPFYAGMVNQCIAMLESVRCAEPENLHSISEECSPGVPDGLKVRIAGAEYPIAGRNGDHCFTYRALGLSQIRAWWAPHSTAAAHYVRLHWSIAERWIASIRYASFIKSWWGPASPCDPQGQYEPHSCGDGQYPGGCEANEEATLEVRYFDQSFST